MVLTADDRAAFERKGYIVVPGVLSNDRLARVNERVRELLARRDADVVSRYGEGKQPVLHKIRSLVNNDPVFRELGQDANIVDIVEELFDEAALIFRDVLVVKPPREGVVVHWHQDSAYWDIDPPALVSAWIALQDVPEDAGCLRFAEGSHTALVEHSLYWSPRAELPKFVSRTLRYAVSLAGTGDNPDRAGGNKALDWLKRLTLESSTRLVPGLARLAEYRIPEQTVERLGYPQVTLPVRAGTVIFFHSLLIHSSAPNTSNISRSAPIISYMRKSSRFTGKGTPSFLPARADAEAITR